MIRHYGVALFLLIGYLFSCGEAVCAPSDLLQQIRRNYGKTSSVYLEFEQSIYWIVREKTTKTTGSITVAPGDKFRVIAGKDLYISNGSVTWQYSKNTNQVVINNLKNLDRSTLPSYLLSTFIDSCNFVETGRTHQQLTLAALPDSTTLPEYREISITVQTPPGIVTSLKFTDKNGNIHTYLFKKTVFNKQYSEKLFEFEAPSDADIIDNRK